MNDSVPGSGYARRAFARARPARTKHDPFPPTGDCDENATCLGGDSRRIPDLDRRACSDRYYRRHWNLQGRLDFFRRIHARRLQGPRRHQQGRGQRGHAEGRSGRSGTRTNAESRACADGGINCGNRERNLQGRLEFLSRIHARRLSRPRRHQQERGECCDASAEAGTGGRTRSSQAGCNRTSTRRRCTYGNAEARRRTCGQDYAEAGSNAGDRRWPGHGVGQ